MCDILLHHSLPFLPHISSKRVKIPRDRRTGWHFRDCMNFYDVAFSAIFNRVMGMGLHIFEISGVRKLWQVRIH